MPVTFFRRAKQDDDDPSVVRLTLKEIVNRAVLSPDGTRLAVASMADVSEPNMIREYLLPDIATPVNEYTVDGPWVSDVQYVGDTLLARVELFMGWTKLLRRTEHGLRVFARGFETEGLFPTRDGYVSVLRGAAGLAFGAEHDECLRGVSLTEGLGLPDGIDCGTVDTEPDANLVAVGGAHLVVMNGDGLRLSRVHRRRAGGSAKWCSSGRNGWSRRPSTAWQRGV